VAVAEIKLPWDSNPVLLTRKPEDPILQALQGLAFADADVASRAESLFMFLRKIAGQASANDYLAGIQYLAFTGDPAGARLLAAFVDVSTPGDRLLPRVNRFSSSRRLKFRIKAAGDDPGNLHHDWLSRLEDLTLRCTALARESGTDEEPPSSAPGRELPWPYLQDSLELLLARHSLGDEINADDRETLVELLRLEVDAWQERISQLAGSIDPFRVAAITRILPLLSIADAEIRDLRQMISWIEEGCQEKDFDKPLSRPLDILEDNDRAALSKVLGDDPSLAPLAGLFGNLADHPVRVPVLAHCVKVLLSLAESLTQLRIPGVHLDLVTAVRLVQVHSSDDGVPNQFRLPLSPGFPRACHNILEAVEKGQGKKAAHLAGVRVDDSDLIVTIPEGGAYLEHDLPAVVAETVEEGQADEVPAYAEDLHTEHDSQGDLDDEIDPKDATVSELKNLVMTNIQSISVLLGFLRNPKVVAIPGLVEEVVNRTRNPKVIETIARVRILHTGFANRGVPLACLRSPVNIPINVLRKFMHVKFVSKVDLKRMALDKAGIRKEVGREIKKYLESLA